MNNLFEPNSDHVIPCFWEFSYRYNSLYRHWALNKALIQNHIKEIQDYPTELLNDIDEGREKYFKEKATGKISDEDKMFYEDDWTEETLMDYTENVEPDINFFPEFLKASTLTMAISTFEYLLDDLSLDLAQELEIKVELPEKHMPYINKYLYWFTRGCGMEVNLSKDKKNKLEAIRNIRNRFAHKINKDIPKNIQETISKMVDTTTEEDLISTEFIETSIKELADLAHSIETSYITFLKRRKEIN